MNGGQPMQRKRAEEKEKRERIKMESIVRAGRYNTSASKFKTYMKTELSRYRKALSKNQQTLNRPGPSNPHSQQVQVQTEAQKKADRKSGRKRGKGRKLVSIYYSEPCGHMEAEQRRRRRVIEL